MRFVFMLSILICLQVLETIGAVLINIFKGLKEQYADEIMAVNQQYPAEPFEYCEPALVLK